MCLYSKTPIPSIAQEDIICYKLVTKLSFPCVKKGESVLMTPYRLKVIDPKKFPFIFKASSDKPIYHYGYNCFLGTNMYAIGEGFIHAYTKHPLVSSFIYNSQCIILCRIPKGTKYYVSLGGDEICASEMELIKIL